jgi:hypothetical protein
MDTQDIVQQLKDEGRHEARQKDLLTLRKRPRPLVIAGQTLHDALPGVACRRPKVEDSRDQPG